jgi:ferric-dicitrate binding protein FerR (iron transport regulator)
MSNTQYYIYIANLITKYTFNSLSDNEIEELKNWIHASQANEKMFRKAIAGLPESLKTKKLSLVEKDKMWSKIEKTTKSNQSINVLKYVASVLIVLSFSLSAYFLVFNEVSQTKVHAESLKRNVKVPTLITATGSEHKLSKKLEISSSSVNIKNNDSELVYNSAEVNKQKKAEYNSLIIPKGGKYKLVLADGTTVWLNSDSRLSYPISFVEDKRRVYLDGEAVFEVAKNKDFPFEVIVRDTKIEVLGTVFNVTAYNDQENITTTLVEGVVNVRNDEKDISRKLEVNEQLILNNKTGDFVCQEVDTRIYTAWIRDRLAFKRERLESIMDRLGRLYEVEVNYMKPTLKNIKFSGEISIYQDIDKIFKMLEKTKKVKFVKSNNKVKILPY